jgi:hypothetical protein
MAEAGQLAVQPGGAYYPPTTGDSTPTPELSPVSPLSPHVAEQHE